MAAWDQDGRPATRHKIWDFSREFSPPTTSTVLNAVGIAASARLEHLIPANRIADFARRWKVTELALFGSVLGDDFDADSDLAILVSFDPAATWSLRDLIAMQDELSSIVGRKVDLVEKEGLRNPFHRQHILHGRKIIYVASQG